MEASDEQLVQRAKRELPYGTRAFEQLLRRYEQRVFATCMRYLNHEQEAEEVSQEIFLRVFHGLPKFREDSTFKTWLFRIAINTSLTRREKISRNQETCMEARGSNAPALEAAIQADQPGTFDQIDGPLGEALDSLSDDDRQILVLRYVSELQISEIAAVCEIGESAAKMRVSRSLQRLKDAYGEFQEKGS